MKKILILSLLAGFSGVVSASEEMYQDSWYSLTGVNLMNGSNRLDVENSSLGYSLKLGKPISKHWDIQAGIGHVESDEDSNRFSNGNYRQSLVGVDAVYLLNRESRLTPILIVGGGVAYNKVDYATATGNYGGGNFSWMANAGAGFQYKISDKFGMQADLRRVWSDADYEGSRHTVGNDYLNVGLTYKFGEPTKVATLGTPVVESPRVVEKELPAPVLTQEVKLSEKITLSSEVLFGFDSSKLKDEGKSKLDAEVVNKLPDNKEFELILITGHTDRIGSEKYNQKLSEDRAKSVKNYLVSKGIADNKLTVVGAGESNPVVNCNDKVKLKLVKCLEPNRRVEVELSK